MISDPVVLFERAGTNAVALAAQVRDEHRHEPTPCTEWSVAEATAGTAMDQLVHTWDLAVAIDEDRTLDPEGVDAIVEMFLPQMPEIGRSAGIVGSEVPVPEGAPAQDRLLGAMGRRP